jgi:hypothetical protein
MLHGLGISETAACWVPYLPTYVLYICSCARRAAGSSAGHQWPMATAPPTTKVLTFMRHGVAAHNVHGAQDPHPDEPERYTDSPLTE